nr:reverse transcriptase [Tanacetum cinerariifolium]
MDLFGPTFVKILMKKMYCLVVTDDYSRIEKLLDHKVKVIRYDNGTEFKIREMNQFFEIKGSGPDWPFVIDALTKTMNFEPIVAGTQSNGFAGTKANDNAGQARKETKPVKDYILLPLWTGDPPFSQDPKSSNDDGSKPLSDDEKTVDEDPRKENKYVSIFNFSSHDEDDGTMANMNNFDTRIQVSPIPTTRIHKDHPFDQVIGDLQSTTQTRKMSKNLKEHGFIKEEVYVCQPPGFEDPDFPDRVYKVERALYGLHQAPRAWFTEVKTASTPTKLKSLYSSIKMVKKWMFISIDTKSIQRFLIFIL